MCFISHLDLIYNFILTV